MSTKSVAGLELEVKFGTEVEAVAEAGGRAGVRRDPLRHDGTGPGQLASGGPARHPCVAAGSPTVAS